MFLRQLSKSTPMLQGLVPQVYRAHIPRLYHASNREVLEDNDLANDRSQLSLSVDSLPANEIITTLEAKKDFINGSHIIMGLNNLVQQYQYFHGTKPGGHFMKKLKLFLLQNKEKLSAQQAVDVIKILDQLQVDKYPEIFPELLQHILYYADDLSFKNFCELWDTIQDRIRSRSKKRILQTALEERFLAKLSMNFIEDDPESFQCALQFASKISQPSEKRDLTQILMSKLANNNGIIPLNSAVSIYVSVQSMAFSQLKLDALQKIQNDIAEQAHLLVRNQIKDIVSIMEKEWKNDKFDHLYNEKLANALAKRLVDGSFTVGFAVLVLSTLSKLRYKSLELLEHCCAEIFKTPVDTNPERKAVLILTLLLPLSVTRHRSVFWDEIQDVVLKSAAGSHRNSSDLVFLAYSLICLDCFSNPMLEKLFDSSFKPSKLDTISRIFCRIYQRLKLDPFYNGPLPTDSQIADLELMLQKSHCARKSRQFPLLEHLKEGMKDLTCIQTDVKTRYFHEFDHVVAVYQDGTPAPISINPSTSSASNDIKYIEDLVVPPGAKLIITQTLSRFWFFRNTNELLGDKKLAVDSMELLPYPVILINEKTWDELPSDERTPFLMNAITAKLDSAN